MISLNLNFDASREVHENDLDIFIYSWQCEHTLYFAVSAEKEVKFIKIILILKCDQR